MSTLVGKLQIRLPERTAICKYIAVSTVLGNAIKDGCVESLFLKNIKHLVFHIHSLWKHIVLSENYLFFFSVKRNTGLCGYSSCERLQSGKYPGCFSDRDGLL